MRRKLFTSIILLLLVSLNLFSVPSTPYDSSLLVYYDELDTKGQRLYDEIYSAIKDFKASIEFEESVDVSLLEEVMSLIYIDAPEFYHLNKDWSYGYYGSTPHLASSVAFSYSMNRKEYERALYEIASFGSNVEVENRDNSLLLEVALHSALLERCDYSLYAPNRQTAYGAIIDRRAVCEGYANALALLLRLNGIRAGVVTGEAWDSRGVDSHAWNIVYVGGEWTVVDPTWNDDEERIGYNYLNISYEQVSRSHREDRAPSFYNRADNSYEINLILGNYVTGNVKDFFFKKLDSLKSRGGYITLAFSSRRDYSSFLSNFENYLDEYNRERGEDGLYGSFYYVQDDSLYVFSLSLD